MSRVNNSSSYSPANTSSVDREHNSPNYGKAALYIAIATVAALAFAALIACSGGSIIIAGFMFSIGLPLDAVAILAGTFVLSLLAGFTGYETYRLSKKADKNLYTATTATSS